MKKILLILFVLLNTANVFSQTFANYFDLKLPDSLTVAVPELADFDNDGLMDLCLLGKTASGNAYLLFVKGDTLGAPALLPDPTEIPSFDSYLIQDFNLDNQLDILLSVTDKGTKKSVLYLNSGSFTFQSNPISLPAFSLARFADVDNDGISECVLSGEDASGNYFTRTYARTNAFDWELRADSLQLALSALEILDLNGNGVSDIFMSGRKNPTTFYSGFYLEKEGSFVEHPATTNEVKALVCDLNTDGSLDVIGFGESQTGAPVYQSFTFGNAFNPQPLAAGGKVISAFYADLNSDGLPDENTVTISTEGDTLNIVRFKNSAEEKLDHKGWLAQRFYDMDQDGDLDILQVVARDGIHVIWLENKTATTNLGPGKMTAFAIPVYNRVLLFWTGVTDDHTVAESLTYDVYLEGNTVSRDISFDLANGKRLRSAHGNNGTNNFMLLRNNGEAFSYAIQAVDNALYANPDGLCLGNGFVCGEVKNEKITACTDEKIMLSAPGEAMWFSFAQGFLGKGLSINFETEKKDTVFYLLPTADCPVVTTYEFELDDKVRKTETETRYVCTEKDVTLTLNTSWADIEWNSENQGSLGSTTEIVYRSDVDDVVSALYKNEEGCTIEKQYTVKISSPQVSTGFETYRLMKGQSVQLSASGAEHYTWSPVQGLSNSSIANPVASPVQDTQYTVTGYDSIGCSNVASVMIFVESTGFIPSLFTPNGDGQNDFLKIYGLTGVDNFSLKVYNREGSIVYKTASLSEALGLGWDGATNGVKQPNGVYFWKVEGELPSGKRLLLNGKEEGSLVLLR